MFFYRNGLFSLQLSLSIVKPDMERELFARVMMAEREYDARKDEFVKELLKTRGHRMWRSTDNELFLEEEDARRVSAQPPKSVPVAHILHRDEIVNAYREYFKLRTCIQCHRMDLDPDRHEEMRTYHMCQACYEAEKAKE